MNPGDTPDRSSIVELLEAARKDLELFRKELSHEEVEVHRKYTQLRDELKNALREMKDMIRESRSIAMEIAEPLLQKLIVLEQQLKPLQQEDDVGLLHQLSGIKRAMEDVVLYLGNVNVFDLSLSTINDRLYRYKIKVGIVKLKLQLGTMQMTDKVLDARHDVTKQLNDLREYTSQSQEGLEKRWHMFHHENTEAYEHLQKAFTAK